MKMIYSQNWRRLNVKNVPLLQDKMHPTCDDSYFVWFFGTNLKHMEKYYCRRQEEPAILTSMLLLCMRHMYVASIRLDFH